MDMAKETNTADFVNVKLLRFDFRFKRLQWREEMAIKLSKEENPLRTILAHALVGVSGLQPESLDKAKQVIEAIPEAIAERVWKVYRGSFPAARRFSTANLYQAPEPSEYMNKVVEETVEEETTHDRTIREMEARFGKQEVAEEAELSRQILRAARKEGKRFAPASPDGRTSGKQ
jgi:hypothetical protein